MIEVLVVDDHRLVRAGLSTLLGATPDVKVVGEAANGAEAVSIAHQHPPDVVLMDISMPVLDGVAATRQIVGEHPQTRVVALTSFSDDRRVSEILGAGAVGYVLKDTEPDELIAAIRAAASGQVPIDPRVAGALLPARGKPADLLSEREAEVLRLAAQGLANKQIGRELGITERTVKVHLGNVFRRIGVSERTSAALWYRENVGG